MCKSSQCWVIISKHVLLNFVHFLLCLKQKFITTCHLVEYEGGMEA